MPVMAENSKKTTSSVLRVRLREVPYVVGIVSLNSGNRIFLDSDK